MWPCSSTRPISAGCAPMHPARRRGRPDGLKSRRSGCDGEVSSPSCACGPERAAPRPSQEGDPAGGGPGPQRRPATLFRRPEPGPLQREAKEPPGAVLRCAAALTGSPCDRSHGDPWVPARPAPGFRSPRTPRRWRPPESCRPFQDDADPRPLPEPHAAECAVAGALNALADLFCGPRLEDDLPDLLWSFVNLFHRKADRITRDLDDNEQAQRRSQAEQDGSEVKSVDLERLIAQGLTLTERRNAFEFLRDHAAEHYAAHTGSAWRPRSGSMVNHRALTAALIDSRDFLNAKRRAETEVLLPPGPRIAFAGGVDYNDHARIWAALDQVREKHPAMVLMHGGAPKGAERIAACWADNRQVPQVAFKPDWARHKNAAPFKRNDQMLEAVPIGVLLFPGSGISENLADKARKMGIPVKRFVPKDGGA